MSNAPPCEVMEPARFPGMVTRWSDTRLRSLEPLYLSRSIRFYIETFGFKLDWGGGQDSIICSVSTDPQNASRREEISVRFGWIHDECTGRAPCWHGIQHDALERRV